MMDAVILAGGLGTRLQPLTGQTPKPMVAVRGRPFLEHQLELLRGAGVRRAWLLVSYLGHVIEEHFRDGARFGLRIEYAREEEPLGTGGALKNAEKRLPPEFLLLNGDTYLGVDYRRLVESFRAAGCGGLVVAYENPEGKLANNLALGEDGQVTAYQKRNPAGLTHVDAGVAVLARRVLALVPPGRVCSLEEEVYPQLIARGELRAFPSRQPFYDIGSFAGLESLAEVVR